MNNIWTEFHETVLAGTVLTVGQLDGWPGGIISKLTQTQLPW